MSQRITYHVTKSGKLWHAKKTSNKTATVASPFKKDVVESIISIAKDQRSSIIIHKANGEIQEERTYPRGSDPRRTRG